MRYLELVINIGKDISEILIAELAESGFDAFVEEDNFLKAYIQEGLLDKSILEELRNRSLNFQLNWIEEQNWNEVWEENFDPIIVENACMVRAAFHKPIDDLEYDIIINPKMSFGTGHHETTYMMIKYLLDHPPVDQNVLDAGCGTGILSILMDKIGAKRITGFDIDEWSVTNALENLELNHCIHVNILQGTIRDIDPAASHGLILANIHKNVLLDEMREYALRLKKDGVLVISGFYEYDVEDLDVQANKEGLVAVGTESRSSWVCRSYYKS